MRIETVFGEAKLRKVSPKWIRLGRIKIVDDTNGENEWAFRHVADATRIAYDMIRKTGFGKLLYGYVILLDKLNTSAAAAYGADAVKVPIKTATAEPLFQLPEFEGLGNEYDIAPHIIHEWGHRLWVQFLNEHSKKQYTELYSQKKPDEFSSNYAKKNEVEGFAEDFRKLIDGNLKETKKTRAIISVLRETGLLK